MSEDLVEQQRAARVRRRPTRGTTIDTCEMVVPCEFANDYRGGMHKIRIAVWDTRQVAFMQCACEGEHIGAATAMYRLGATGTCGFALGWLRRWVLGESGQAEIFVERTFSPAVRAFLAQSRAHSIERRRAHRTFVRQFDFDRPGEELLSRMLRDGMGWDVAEYVVKRASPHRPPTFRIATNREGLPVSAYVNDQKVAVRVPKVDGWMLKPAAIKAAAEAACPHNIYGCPTCVRFGNAKSTSVRRGFIRARTGGDGARCKHATSRKHVDAFERGLIETLANLPGVGSQR